MNDEGEKDLEVQAKMEELFNKLGISVYKANGELKNTYEIMGSLAPVYETLNNAERAYVTETIAGKYQAQNAAALLNNWTTAVEANETAINSQGSALTENEKVLDSIEGKINAFKSAFQELSKDLVSSDLVKGVVDFGTAILRFANDDTIKQIAKMIATFMAFKMAGAVFNTLGVKLFKVADKFGDVISTIKKYNEVNKLAKTSTNALTTAEEAKILTDGKAVISQIALNAVLAAGAVALTLITSAYQSYKQKQEQARQSAIEDAETLKEWNEGLKEEAESINNYRKVLESSQSSQENVASAKESLIKIQDELIERYGSEAEGIDLVNGKIDEQIKKIQELNSKKAQEWINKNQSAIDEAKNKKNSIVQKDGLYYSGELMTNWGAGSWNKTNFMADWGKSHGYDVRAENGIGAGTVYSNMGDEKTLEYLNKLSEYLQKNKQNVLDAGFSEKQYQDMLNDVGNEISQIEKDYASYNEILEQNKQNILFAAEGYNDFIDEATELGNTGSLNADTMDKLLEKYPSVKNAISEAGIEVGDLITKYNDATKATENVKNATTDADNILTVYSKELDKIQAKYETLTSAVDEYNEAGFLSAETLKKIMDNGLLEYLSYENGHLVANTEALYNKAEAQRIASSQELANAMTADILKVAENDVEHASNLAKTAVANLGNNAETAGNKAANATGQFISFATAVDQANKALEGKELTDDIQSKIDAVKNAYKPAFDLLSQPIKINKKTYTSPSKKSSSSSSKSQKEWWETELQKLKDQFNYNEITIEEYIDGLDKLLGKTQKGSEAWREINEELQKQRLSKVDDDFKAGRISVDEYIASLKELLKAYKEGTKDWNNINDKIQKQRLTKIEDDYKAGRISLEQYIAKLKELLKAYKEGSEVWDELAEKIKNGLQDQAKETKDSYDDAKSAIDKVIDDEIEKLEKELELLKEKNDETEKAMELERLQEALENAKREKTKRVWNGSQWIWMADQSAIDNAQKELDDFVKAEEEAAKSEAIQNKIDELNDLKNQYEDVTHIYDQEQQKQQLIAMLGANAEADILNQRIDTLNKFKDKYIAIQQQIAAYDKATPESLVGDTSSTNSSSNQSSTPEPVVNNPAPSTSTSNNGSASLSQDEIDRLAKEVIRGKYGNGAARVNALGANYNVVQNRVNQMLKGRSYASGGIVDYTGLAMLHGSPSKPEVVMNYDQIKNLMATITRPNVQSNIKNTGQSIVYNFSGDFNLPNVDNAQKFLRDLKAQVNIKKHSL